MDLSSFICVVKAPLILGSSGSSGTDGSIVALETKGFFLFLTIFIQFNNWCCCCLAVSAGLLVYEQLDLFLAVIAVKRNAHIPSFNGSRTAE